MHMRFLSLRSLLTTSLLAVIWSCSSNNHSPATSQTTPRAHDSAASSYASNGAMQELRASCPMAVQGANVAVRDTAGGVTLSFTTKSGDVAELRDRVEHLAAMYEMQRGQGMRWHAMGPPGRGHGGPGMGRGHGAGPMPSATATLFEMDDGVALELRPTDPSQLEALREHARWHQQRMQSGECWMVQQQEAESRGGAPE